MSLQVKRFYLYLEALYKWCILSKNKDIAIINDLRDDVRGSYAVLYKKYYGMVSHLVTKNNGTLEDASDIFQDTVIVLFEMTQKKTFILNSALSTLLYSIARNIWFKELRKKKNQSPFLDFEKHIEIDEEEENQFVKEEIITLMEKTIGEMGDPCKTILIQYYYFRKKMREIADLLAYKSADHAKTQKYKCLQRLRQLVQR